MTTKTNKQIKKEKRKEKVKRIVFISLKYRLVKSFRIFDIYDSCG